ncbi:MAG: mechanosensitive ion channel family protein [Thermoanaerobaculales bacterium]|jgi:small-conductance mechanosensitive channel|nr:mechanosensitive ion channel family protein [Thermoanaerobaculales bacterium]
MAGREALWRRAGVLLGVALIAVAIPVRAEDTPPDRAEEPTGAFELGVEIADVEIDGEILFSVRGVSAYPADRRAREIAARIVAVARDPAVVPEDVVVVDGPNSSELRAGEQVLMLVVDADAELNRLSRHDLGLALTGRIRDAISVYREGRSREALVRAAVTTAIATAVLVLALLVLRWGWRRLDAGLAARVERSVQAIGSAPARLIRPGDVERSVRTGLRWLHLLAVVVLVLGYLEVVFGLFPWTRWMHRRLFEWTVGPLETIGGAVLDQIPNLIFLVVLVVVVRLVLRVIRVFFDAVGRGAITVGEFDPEWARPTYNIVRLALVAFSIVVAYPYIPGSGSAAFKGVSIFAGVIFSLGSSSIVSNVIAGYTMTYRRAYRVGDRVRIGGVMGDVTDIRLQVTKLRTPKNEEVVVPNSLVLGSEVTNYTSFAKSRGLILHTTVGIGYETPWRQVEAMLLMAAGRTPGLLTEPPPFVLKTLLGDYCVTFELNAYTDTPAAMLAVYSSLHANILDVFNEYGVQIMTPSYVADPEVAKVVPPGQLYAEPAVAPEE